VCGPKSVCLSYILTGMIFSFTLAVSLLQSSGKLCIQRLFQNSIKVS